MSNEFKGYKVNNIRLNQGWEIEAIYDTKTTIFIHQNDTKMQSCIHHKRKGILTYFVIMALRITVSAR